MASTRGLNRRWKPLAEALVQVLREYGPYRITSGKRSRSEQVTLYQRWLRGDPGVMTPAPPGHSQHERGYAVDIANPHVKPKDDANLRAIGEAWRAAGGVWGGEADPVHFEAPKSWTGRA